MDVTLNRILSLLEELADELASEIDARHGLPEIELHPALKGKYERDMATVVEAHEVITAIRENGLSVKGMAWVKPDPLGVAID